jgi:hypothetical protein
MKRILFSLLLLAPFFASAQSGSINAAAVRSRVTDSTTVATPTGYGVIYYNAQSNKFRVYQNGAWTNLTGGSGGGGGGISPSDNVTWTGTASWRDNNFSLFDNADLTKIGKFELSGITTATTRTITWPNASGTMALTSDIPSLSTYVVGPASAVNNRVAFFDGTTGKLIKDSGLTLSGSNTGDQTITLTGELTGSGTGSFATTLAKTSITNRTLVTAAASDHVLIADASDSDNLKKVLVSDLTGGGGSGDVVGPASATNNNFSLFDGATGKLLKNSSFSSTDAANAVTAFGWGNHAGLYWNITGNTTLSGATNILGGGLRNLSLGTIGSKINDFLVVADNSVSLNSDLNLDLTSTGPMGIVSSDVLSLQGLTSIDFTTPITNINSDVINLAPNVGADVTINTGGVNVNMSSVADGGLNGSWYFDDWYINGDNSGTQLRMNQGASISTGFIETRANNYRNGFTVGYDGAARGFGIYTGTAGANKRLWIDETGTWEIAGATGSSGDILTINGSGLPEWSAPSGGGDMLLGTSQTVTASKTFNTGTFSLRNPANTFSYNFLGSAIVANRNVTLPLLTGNDTFVMNDFAATLTNKTIAAGSNTITGLVDANINAHTTTKITTTSKSLLNSAIVYTDQINAFGDFNNTFRSTRLRVANPANTFFYSFTGSAIAADRAITLPLLTGGDVMVTADFGQTLTNKTLALGSNTISGTKAQFNTAVTDGNIIYEGVNAFNGGFSVTANSGANPITFDTSGPGNSGDILLQVGGTDDITLSGPSLLSTTKITSSSTGAGSSAFNMLESASVSSPINGDIWVNGGGFARGGGVTHSFTNTNTGDQSLANTSNATSHTVTLTGGTSVQLIEGANITLTTGGTGGAGTVTIASTGGGGVSDGDKGDITVSGSGATWTIDNSAVSLAKMADIATSSLIYRKTAGTGAPEVNTLATLKTDLGLTGTNSGDQSSIVGITGTKAQFNTAVTDGDILYVGDVTSNVTHTGEVTGSGALTVDKTAITNRTLVTASASDHVLIADASDSDNLKKVLVSDLTGGGSGDMVLASAQTSTGKKTFAPDATNAGINIGSRSGAPSTLVNADAFYDSFSDSPEMRIAGSTRHLAFIGGANQANGVPYSNNILSGSLTFNSAFNFNGTILNAPELGGRLWKVKTESGSTYTLVAGDLNYYIEFTNAAGCAVTLPDGLSADFTAILVNKSVGSVTLAATTTLESAGTIITDANTAATVYHKGSNVWTAVGSLGYTPESHGRFDYWQDSHFGTTDVAQNYFLGAAISSGTNTTAVPGADAVIDGYHHGLVFLRSSTTANGGYRYQSSSLISRFFGLTTHKYVAKVLWRTSFTDRTVRLGFHDASTVTDAVDGAYFEVVASTASAKTANNSTRTTNGTTLTLSLDVWYRFEIEVDAGGTAVGYKIYNDNTDALLLDVTNSTNIPTSRARAFGVGLVATEVSTTASDMVVIDYMGVGTIAGYNKKMR